MIGLALVPDGPAPYFYALLLALALGSVAAMHRLAQSVFGVALQALRESVASVSTSVDALLVVVLGGVHQLWGAVAASAVLSYAGV